MDAEFGGVEQHPSLEDLRFSNEVGEFGGDATDKLSKPGDKSILRDLRREKRIMNHLTRPSSTLTLGSDGNLREKARARLLYLLDKAVRQRNWEDMSGILSVLLQGTCKERSLHNNCFKYSIALELLEHIGNDHADSKDVENFYNLWMKKIAPKKAKPWRDRSVLYDSIFSFLRQENYAAARSSAICLSLDREADHDPVSNLVLGLCYYEMWYATLPMHRRLSNIYEPETLDETEESGTDLHQMAENSEEYQDISVDANSSFNYHSETSVVNNKVILNDDLNRTDPSADTDQRHVTTRHQSNAQRLYMSSGQISGSQGGSLRRININIQFASSSIGVPDALLFPVHWDPLNESIEDAMRDLKPNDDYKDAVQYLCKALNSPPGASDALLPLVQLLFLNDQVEEALDEIEKLCRASNSLYAIRLKTHYFECLDCGNHEVLVACYDDILKKDPTCQHSVTRLIRSYHMGYYDLEQLLEAIALHLEASFPDHNIWREFALCLLRVSQCEEDCHSTCLNVDTGAAESSQLRRKIPSMFVKGVSGRNWKLRCKWWLNRHFSHKLLASDIAAGDKSLMVYKAASAAHLYGPGFRYVVEVGATLKKEGDPLLRVLKTHVRSSSGFYPELGAAGSKGGRSWQEVFGKEATKGGEASGERGSPKTEETNRKKGRPRAGETSRKRGRPRKEERQLEG